MKEKLFTLFFCLLSFSSYVAPHGERVTGIIPYFYFQGVAYFVMRPLESVAIVNNEHKIARFYNAFNREKEHSFGWQNVARIRRGRLFHLTAS